MLKKVKRVAISGGGPSGLFVLKRLIETAGELKLRIEIFEKKNQLGVGMPYSKEGACEEHITNVSGNEIPGIVIPIKEWIKTAPQQTLDKFNISAAKFNDYKVLPRLLFGQYLEAQFKLLLQRAKEKGIHTKVHLNTVVKDIVDDAQKNIVAIKTNANELMEFDYVVICTGHVWPKKHESKIACYFDSPYPPQKLALKLNHAVAIKGSSLTAIDTIRTLAKHNGGFIENESGKVSYRLAKGSEQFRMMMYSVNGLLPAVRFHLKDSHLSNESSLTQEDININRQQHDGFLSLDYVFERAFKEPIKEKQPEFYKQIKNMNLEKFVECMMNLRENIPPFLLLKAEYDEAAESIKKRQSVYWKEMLAVLSFMMNYPAKYFSAEDMLRLQKVLMPLISIVIAFVPQSSVEQMLALYQAGVLDVTPVDEDSKVEPQQKGGATYHFKDEHGRKKSVYYNTYVDSAGQPHLSLKDLPFKSLIDKKTVSQARLKFKDPAAGLEVMQQGNEDVIKDEQGNYYLNVQGIAINDNFQVVDEYGIANERICMMAVPYIGGYNPDYSGLDFCEEASSRVVESIVK